VIAVRIAEMLSPEKKRALRALSRPRRSERKSPAVKEIAEALAASRSFQNAVWSGSGGKVRRFVQRELRKRGVWVSREKFRRILMEATKIVFES